MKVCSWSQYALSSSVFSCVWFRCTYELWYHLLCILLDCSWSRIKPRSGINLLGRRSLSFFGKIMLGFQFPRKFTEFLWKPPSNSSLINKWKCPIDFWIFLPFSLGLAPLVIFFSVIWSFLKFIDWLILLGESWINIISPLTVETHQSTLIDLGTLNSCLGDRVSEGFEGREPVLRGLGIYLIPPQIPTPWYSGKSLVRSMPIDPPADQGMGIHLMPSLDYRSSTIESSFVIAFSEN